MKKLTRVTPLRGFSLIEAAIVLAIVGLVIGGIWVAASAVSGKFKISETAKGLLSSCERSSRIFNGKNTHAGSSEIVRTSEAIAAGVFPAGWVKSSSTVTSPLGDIILTQSGDTASWGGMDFAGVNTYYIKDMPKQYCMQFLASLPLHSKNLLAYMITGATAPVIAGGPGWGAGLIFDGPLPYTGDIATLCTTSGSIVSMELDCMPR